MITPCRLLPRIDNYLIFVGNFVVERREDYQQCLLCTYLEVEVPVAQFQGTLEEKDRALEEREKILGV